ncbi:uncharacterized protein DS421_11g326350 [Arachis hypogaea]|nr:uncharacterized protein DS421_11g326350 [Arachis hypogaea]
MKWALSNEQQLQEGGDHFLSYVLNEMSKVDMQNFIEKSNSLMDRLNAEKERAESLSKVLKTI